MLLAAEAKPLYVVDTLKRSPKMDPVQNIRPRDKSLFTYHRAKTTCVSPAFKSNPVVSEICPIKFSNFDCGSQ